jgi:hypothetical protein
MKQTGIGAVQLREVYHDWLGPTAEANAEQKAAILRGDIGVPSGSRLMVEIDTIPKTLPAGELALWPVWTVELSRDGVLIATDTFTEANQEADPPFEGEVGRVQSPHREGGVWLRSRGHRWIFIGPVVEEASALTFRATAGAWEAEPLVIPLVSRPSRPD